MKMWLAKWREKVKRSSLNDGERYATDYIVLLMPVAAFSVSAIAISAVLLALQINSDVPPSDLNAARRVVEQDSIGVLQPMTGELRVVSEVSRKAVQSISTAQPSQ